MADVKRKVGRPLGEGNKVAEGERISFSYSNSMKQKLIKYAKRERRPLAAYIKLVLEKHIEMREKKDAEAKVK